MASRTDFDVQVAGLKELIEGLAELQGPALPKVITDSLRRTARGVVVPAIKQQLVADMKRPGSHKDPKPKNDLAPNATPKKPKPGRGGPMERNVTVRTSRKRGGELVALNIGSRAWYDHFLIGGTRPHVIAARGRGRYGRFAPSSVVRSINREEFGTSYLGPLRRSGKHGTRDLTRAGQALFINGFYRERVRHPGSRGTDSIRKAVQGVVPTLNARYVADLQKAYDKHLTGPTRRARPRPPG